MTVEIQTQSIAGGLELVVRADRLSVSLSVSTEAANRETLIEEIRTKLSELKIAAPVDFNSLGELVNSIRSDNASLTNHTLVRGTAPQPSQNGFIEWSRDYFTEGYLIDPVTQTVDFRRMASVPSVAAEELIVTVHPPQPGSPGVDVFGANIAVDKPRSVELKAGRGIYWDESVSGYRAKLAGRVKLNGNALEVHDLYEIPQDVGPETGNVNHPGSVVIKGEVNSEFAVEAVGDIEVLGLIGAADIRCGGNLTAKTGIRSAPGKRIVVKGNFFAKYLECAHVFCEGDVVVESEILDSSVRTTGKVICAGRVHGGEIIAANGIQVGESGTKAETRTVMIAGVNYLVANELREATEEAKKLKEELIKLKLDFKRLEMFGATMSPKQREAMTELDFKLFDAQERYDALTEKRKALAVNLHANKDAIIHIERQLNSGTLLRVLEAQLEVRQTLLGPIQAGINLATRELSLTSAETAVKE